MGRNLNAQICRSCLGVFCEPVQNLLPATDQVQVGNVIKAFVSAGISIGGIRLVLRRNFPCQSLCAGEIIGDADPHQRHDAWAVVAGGILGTGLEVRQDVG